MTTASATRARPKPTGGALGFIFRHVFLQRVWVAVYFFAYDSVKNSLVFVAGFHRFLVDLDLAVDLADEDVGRVEPDRASQDPEGYHDHHAVAEVEQRRHERRDLKLRVKVKNAVKKNIKSGPSRNHKTPPPPVIILSTQLKVNHHNTNLTTSNHQNGKDQKQKAKQIVVLVLPNSRKHKEQFNENGAKG